MELDPHIQQESEESGYEFGSYNSDSLPEIEATKLSRNIENWKSMLLIKATHN